MASFECITRSKISKADLFDRSLSIDAHVGSMAKSREKAVRKGPFRRFRHIHEFLDDGEETVMIDRIEFAAPLGPAGRIAERLLLARYLRDLIETRNRYLTGQ
ncbi:hypothetical protein AAIH25_08245 [Arthrobacter crystallopoietes]|uniref:SRPBCC family protein n=1 Tax=Crystallibacter crystallopoietes TaxID=37928 RepID=UPI003D2066CF